MAYANQPLCFQCGKSSRALCVNCKVYFCLKHFDEHQQIYEDYFNDSSRSFENLFKHSKFLETKFEQEIHQWEEENINEIRRSANQVRRTLQAHLNNARSQFKEECQRLENINIEENRDQLINRLEKFHLDYRRSLDDLRLVKPSAVDATMEIQSHNSPQEGPTINDYPSQSDNFVPQSSLAGRVLQDPLTIVSTGSFWAMGGSDQYLLVQEYETNQIISFNQHGQRCFSIPWPNDLAVRDINWYSPLKQFIFLLDKKVMLFDPLTENVQEVSQVKAYQSYNFRRFTCANDHLYLVYWGLESVVDLIRISTWKTEQRWFTPVTCGVNECITAMRLNSLQQVGLAIQDENNPSHRRFRFEIRDLSLALLHKLPLHTDSGIFSRLLALPDRHWALLNIDETFIFVINENGQLVDKVNWNQGILCNISLLAENIVVIRSTNKICYYDVKFH